MQKEIFAAVQEASPMKRPLKTIFAAIILMFSVAAPAAADAGVDVNVAYLSPLADSGYSGAVYANRLGEPEDYPEALRWYRLAADQSDADAQYNLGLAYANGQGVAQDYPEAVKWYRLAADQGHARAQNALGIMYARGKACRRTMPKQ
jgi:TPR repeat protein